LQDAPVEDHDLLCPSRGQTIGEGVDAVLTVASNFSYPGQSPVLDENIRRTLALYPPKRILVYVASRAEIGDDRGTVAFYGLMLNEKSCLEVTSHSGENGYLCGVEARREPEVPETVGRKSMAGPEVPEFRKLSQARLRVTPREVAAGRGALQYSVVGMQATEIDVIYTLNREPMPPIRHWRLDGRQSTQVFVDSTTRKGLYHIIGIRRSGSPDPNRWIEVDVRVRIK
jgi:hypothetical protein